MAEYIIDKFSYDGNTYKLNDERIPTATSSDTGKYLTINSSGEIVVGNLPIYDGSVRENARGVNF